MTRLAALVELLTSYLDAHPWPEGQTGREHRRSSTGSGALDFLLGAIERQRHAHSAPVWRDLETALRWLSAEDPTGASLIVLAYVLAVEKPETMREQQRRRLVVAMRALDRAMPDGFEQNLPGELAHAHEARAQSLVDARGRQADARAQARRDVEIRRLYETGEWTQTQLAAHFRLSQGAVSAIVNGEMAAA